MLQTPEAMNTVKKEAAGLESKGTWDNTTVREQDAIKEEARRKGMTIHLGSLMSICSIKFAELAKHLQIYKGMLVYRGEKRSMALPAMKPLHWAKKYFEKTYLRHFQIKN